MANKGSAESVLISKRQLIELYALVLQFRQLMDDATRHRIEATGICNEVEQLISKIAPGIIADAHQKSQMNEITPVQIPRPCPVCRAPNSVSNVKCTTCGHVFANNTSEVRKKEDK